MEKTILIDPEVRGLLETEFVAISLYTDRDAEPYSSNRDDIKDAITGQGTNPIYVVMAPDGREVLGMIGYTQNREDFLEFLRTGEKYF